MLKIKWMRSWVNGNGKQASKYISQISFFIALAERKKLPRLLHFTFLIHHFTTYHHPHLRLYYVCYVPASVLIFPVIEINSDLVGSHSAQPDNNNNNERISYSNSSCCMLCYAVMFMLHRRGGGGGVFFSPNNLIFLSLNNTVSQFNGSNIRERIQHSNIHNNDNNVMQIYK